MRFFGRLLLGLAFAVLVATAAGARDAARAAPASIHPRQLTISATVAAIDYDNRAVTLAGPKGNSVVLVVARSVRNFEKVKQGDKVNGSARIKAKLAKAGNQIQFTTIRRQNTMKGDIEITVRETWKLSKDGKQMRFERTVETPTARDQIVMVLAKAAA